MARGEGSRRGPSAESRAQIRKALEERAPCKAGGRWSRPGCQCQCSLPPDATETTKPVALAGSDSDSDHNVAAAPGHWRLVDAAGPGASHVPVGHLGLLALPLSGTQAAALRASDTVTGSGSCQWPSRGGQPRGGTVATFTFLPRKPAAGGGATQPALAVAWAACGPGGRCVCQASGGRNARASRGSPRP